MVVIKVEKFVCKTCSKAYTRSDTLKTHMKLHNIKRTTTTREISELTVKKTRKWNEKFNEFTRIVLEHAEGQDDDNKTTRENKER